ncbi:MAG: hypothetical protein ACRDV8_11960, partial [Acidimicrobiales bacterium]
AAQPQQPSQVNGAGRAAPSHTPASNGGARRAQEVPGGRHQARPGVPLPSDRFADGRDRMG